MPDERGAVIDIHSELLRIRGVKLHELAVDQALCEEGQARTVNRAVLLLLDDRRTSLSALGVAVRANDQEEPSVLGQQIVIRSLEDRAVSCLTMKHTDLARLAVARLEPEQVFILVVHYVV